MTSDWCWWWVAEKKALLEAYNLIISFTKSSSSFIDRKNQLSIEIVRLKATKKTKDLNKLESREVNH